MFQPKEDIAQAEKIYDLALRKIQVGQDLLTYDEINQVLGFDIRMESRSAIYEGMKKLESRQKRTLAVDKNHGYRIVLPKEHAVLARAHHRKGRSQLKKSMRKLKYTQTEMLDSTDRAEHAHLYARIAQHEKALADLDKRVAEGEARDAAMEQAQEEMRADIRKMKRDLMEFERKLKNP